MVQIGRMNDVKSGNLYLLALTERNANVTMVMEFLNHLVKVFKDYFGVFDEERIRYLECC